MTEKAVRPEAHTTIRLLILGAVITATIFALKSCIERSDERWEHQCPQELKACRTATSTAAEACKHELRVHENSWQNARAASEREAEITQGNLAGKLSQCLTELKDEKTKNAKEREELSDSAETHEKELRRVLCKELAVTLGFDHCDR